jgi:hypothetical protein
MTIIERITQIDRKFAWSFLGVLLALFGLWYFRDNPPSLRIELLSRARVYDIHADVPNLTIFFENENIKEKKQVLSFFTVRVSNSGGRPITQNLYDTNLPFGLQLFNGRAFPPEVVDASQKYITENLKPSLANNGQIRFEKVVIDPEASFTIRFLVLHGQGLDPSLKPVGKIAGIAFDNLQIIEPSAGAERQSFWRELLSGSPLVHVVRFVGYSFTLLLLMLAIFLPLSVITSIWDDRKERRISSRFHAYQGSRDSSYANILAKIAVEYGDKGLVLASRLDGLHVSERQLKHMIRGPISHNGPVYYNDDPFFFAGPVISRLKNAQVLGKTEKVFTLNKKFKEQLNDFLAFWRATEPSNTEATERFVTRTIQRIKVRSNNGLEPRAAQVESSGEQELRIS